MLRVRPTSVPESRASRGQSRHDPMSKYPAYLSATRDEPGTEPPASGLMSSPVSRPRWSRPAAGFRGAIDALIQGALVELFQIYGVALAPSAPNSSRSTAKGDEVCAAIGFTRAPVDHGASQPGRLALAMPTAVFALLKGYDPRSARRDDWAREFTNQLMGRIKNRLLPFGPTLRIGLPCSTD